MRLTLMISSCRTKDWARGVLLRTRHPWLVSLREALEAGVDFPPEESLPGIVARERRNRHTSITKLRGAVQGNIGFIARQMQGRYTLQRGRTFFEFLQVRGRRAARACPAAAALLCPLLFSHSTSATEKKA